MVNNSRKGMLFGVMGLVVGVAAGAMGMLSLRGGDGPYASSPPTRMMGAAPATSTAFVTAVAGNCELAPVLPNGGDGDGRQQLQAKPGAASASEVASLILSGKEAAAAGRQRDAEIDFLNACRNAATLQDGDPVPLADAMYQLGRHYANVGAFGALGKGKELFQRAERLYSASLEGYRARYGEDHEKTRFAREGLVTVQHATGGKAPTAIARAAPAAAPAQPAEAAPAVAAASAPVVPAPAASAAEPAREVAKAPAAAPRALRPRPQVAAPVTEARAPHEAAPAQEQRARDDGESATASAAPRAAPAIVPAPAAERRPAPIIDGAVEPPRPRPQARRPPPTESSVGDESEVAVDVPPPPPRRPRPVPPPEPTYEAPAPAADIGTAGGAPSAEGSPDSQ